MNARVPFLRVAAALVTIAAPRGISAAATTAVPAGSLGVAPPAVTLASPSPAPVASPPRTSAAPVSAEAPLASERAVKAAFLYKFAGYVEWPRGAGAESDSTVIFGVMSDDGVADDLTRLVQHRARDARPVRVVRCHPFEPLPKLHVLFIGHGESDRLPTLIRAAHEQPVLIVTDSEGALAVGSMINFVSTHGHVRFEVGLGAAQKCGLTLSSRLIAVAQYVSRGTP